MCWKRIGSPPIAGSKIPMCNSLSSPNKNKVMAITGVPRIKITLVAYIAQMNSGNRNHVNPGARIL
jgi:hypothetical protein